LLRDSPILNNRKKQNENTRRRHFIINEQEAIDLFNKHHPSMLDELRGLADALDWEMADALREFGGYYVDYAKSGCSILTGNDFMIEIMIVILLIMKDVTLSISQLIMGTLH